VLVAIKDEVPVSPEANAEAAKEAFETVQS
jgi:hypothetical protein